VISPVVVERVRSNVMKNIEAASELVALDVEADCAVHHGARAVVVQVGRGELLGRADVCRAGPHAGHEAQATGARRFVVVHRVAQAHASLRHLPTHRHYDCC